MRKMNCKMLAAALVAVQIAVTAMPATAFAAENDQIQETVQAAQEQVEASAEEPAPAKEAEEAPAFVAEAPAKEEEAAPAETEASVEEPEEVVETETQKESAAEVTEEPEETEKTTETAEVTENKEETKASEKPAEGQAFDQTVTVDRVKVRVTAEEGAFEEGAKLSVVRVPSTQLKEVENAVADARAKDELVKSAYAFDVKVVGKDGSSLQPAAGKKVKVSFGTEEAADGSLGAVVYHIVGPKNNIKAQKLATTVNREAKAAEAQTTGLSYYVVEFVSKSTDANTDANVPAKTEPTDDTDKTAKTETTEDTKTTGKTDPVPEDNNTKTETVTPAAKDTAKTGTETTAQTPAVKKETKTETKTSEVKKEKKSENKKKETAKKESSKKKEKAKTNDKKSPKTGDTSNMVIWITTSLLAVGGIIVLLAFRRRLR